MQKVSRKELALLLGRSGLTMADPSLGIGRQMTFEPAAKRTFVIHFGESDEDHEVHATIGNILLCSEAWVLLERHARKVADEQAGLRYDRTDHEDLREALGSIREIGPQGVGDLYLMSNEGSILLTWDHHTWNEGLVVQFSDVASSNEALLALNRGGTEMEIFYTP